MTTKTKKPAKLSLKDAFETEYAKRLEERRAREEAERKQHEQDLESATELHELLKADAKFLEKHGLTVDQRRYTVSIDHANYRIAAYFEGGRASVTIEHGERDLRISVRDAGRQGGAVSRLARGRGGGHGIAGMRERARMFGGTLEARPAGPGFEVLVSLPVSAASCSRTTAPRSPSRPRAGASPRSR